MENSDGGGGGQDARVGKQLSRAIAVVEANGVISASEKGTCLEILRRLGNEHQRLYFPDETADAVVLLVTKAREPSDDKRARQVYQKIRDEIQEWGLVESPSLERSSMKDFAEVCIKLEFEPEHIEALVKHYHHVLEKVLLGGKTPPYTIAAVLLHFTEKVTGSSLSQTQIAELCQMLKIKHKTLKRYTEMLAQNCGSPPPPPPAVVGTTTTSSSSKRRKKMIES